MRCVLCLKHCPLSACHLPPSQQALMLKHHFPQEAFLIPRRSQIPETGLESISASFLSPGHGSERHTYVTTGLSPPLNRELPKGRDCAGLCSTLHVQYLSQPHTHQALRNDRVEDTKKYEGHLDPSFPAYVCPWTRGPIPLL